MNILLEEAKIMASVSRYHENIINLQGIAVDVQANAVSEVYHSDIQIVLKV